MLTHSLCDLVMFCVVMEGGSRVPLIFAADSTGRVAQRIRRLTTNQKIVGSNPIVIIFLKESIPTFDSVMKNLPLRVGFEPTREDPI